MGRGPVGKTAIIGIKDRKTNQVEAEVAEQVDADTLQGFVARHTEFGTTVYTDDARAYQGMHTVDHETINHSAGEYVNEQAHTNGIESFWALLKRGYHGTYHHFSVMHLSRYIDEFAGRYNARSLDTEDQMRLITMGDGREMTQVQRSDCLNCWFCHVRLNSDIEPTFRFELKFPIVQNYVVQCLP